MRHYLLANNAPVSPVFEWIERAAVFIEVLAVEMEGRWPWQPTREGHRDGPPGRILQPKDICG